MLLPPAFAVTVPGHVLLIAGVPATKTLDGATGRLSTKAAVKVAADVLVLLRKIVTVLVPPAPMTGGENCLLTDGGLAMINAAELPNSLVTPSKVEILLGEIAFV